MAWSYHFYNKLCSVQIKRPLLAVPKAVYQHVQMLAGVQSSHAEDLGGPEDQGGVQAQRQQPQRQEFFMRPEYTKELTGRGIYTSKN